MNIYISLYYNIVSICYYSIDNLSHNVGLNSFEMMVKVENESSLFEK